MWHFAPTFGGNVTDLWLNLWSSTLYQKMNELCFYVNSVSVLYRELKIWGQFHFLLNNLRYMLKQRNHDFTSVAKKLSLQYATRISSNRKIPAKAVVFKPQYSKKVLNKSNELKPLSPRIKQTLKYFKLNWKYIFHYGGGFSSIDISISRCWSYYLILQKNRWTLLKLIKNSF